MVWRKNTLTPGCGFHDHPFIFFFLILQKSLSEHPTGVRIPGFQAVFSSGRIIHGLRPCMILLSITVYFMILPILPGLHLNRPVDEK